MTSRVLLLSVSPKFVGDPMGRICRLSLLTHEGAFEVITRGISSSCSVCSERGGVCSWTVCVCVLLCCILLISPVYVLFDCVCMCVGQKVRFVVVIGFRCVVVLVHCFGLVYS